ncbi:hypothetical protein SDC9_80526 [bioreactor metagenome]|uniref:N-acetyltransferase domain-containing protein n=1 Tax=bioreactor metagenome TaxID=1076179 RepID=A0A644YZ89_9ZZZZ
MSVVSIMKVTKENVDEEVIKQLSQVLTYSEPENFKECEKWWRQWFSDKILGDKITIVAKEENNIIGVTRFWRTPFCNNKWLIEGLEVILPQRRKGVGKAIVTEGIRILKGITNEKIFVHIDSENNQSKRLHEVLGLKKNSSGSLNSYGDYRNYIDEYVLEV